MSKRGCLTNAVYFVLLFILFGFSSYFWFKFFVRGKSIPTPALIGKAVPEARAICSDQGLVLVVDNSRDRHADRVAVGSVAWMNRSPGTLIKRGTRIYVGQSLGPLVLSVPDLAGQSARTALLRFSQRNLRMGNLSHLDLAGARNIVAEDPPAGTVVQGQTAVSLLVGYPPVPLAFVMPDLIDHNLDQVRYALEAKGLNVSSVRFESYPGIPDGTIIRQFPPPGGPIRAGEAISLVVAKEEAATTLVPPVGVNAPQPVPAQAQPPVQQP